MYGKQFTKSSGVLRTSLAIATGALTASATLAGGSRVAGSGAQAAPAPKASSHVRLVGDLNGDRRIDTQDLLRLMDHMRHPSGAPRVADLNRDGQVNTADLGMFLENFDDMSPPLPPGDPVWRMTSTLVGDGTKLEMIDNETEFYVINPTNTKLWSPISGAPNPCLVTPTIDLVPHPDGCDLIFTFVNNTQEWSGLGKISVAGVRFGESITGHDFRFDGKPITLNADNTGIGVSGWYYPGGTYAPVNVVEDGSYKMGVSLIYPILDYKHQVKIRCKAQNTTGGPAWFHEFTLNANHENKYNPGGDLAPGESRVYIASVRVAKGAERWQATLQPYREFFQSLYGSVRYHRDPTPAQFTTLAVDGNMGPDNPYGFTGGVHMRADVHGFGPWVDRFVTRGDLGFTRIMVSKTTGNFYVNQHNNIPPIFTSHWLEGSEYGHNLGNAIEQFNRVPASGVNLGLWWGRSAQVMPDGWDTWLIEDLNPHNPEHVLLALRELDLAYEAGARLIGLDAFRKMQAWDAVVWLNLMQARAPDARFITEPLCGDVIHNLTPAFQVATRPASEADLRVETRHFLADLLNPGHETWGYARIDRLTDYLGREPTLEDWIAEGERIASLGYVPCLSEPIPITPAMVAAETWHLDD